MQKTAIKIGPADHGRRMSLEDFDHAEVQEGYRYELGRGVIIVSDVPHLFHGNQVDFIRQDLAEYRAKKLTSIAKIFGPGECKILLTDLESERHPDVAIYKKPPLDLRDLWATWIPDVAIEVVSTDSEHRDYVEKREEYLIFGIREYWIVDAYKQQMLVLTRRGGKWTQRVIRPPEIYQTKLLPGYEFNIGKVFEAAVSGAVSPHVI